MAPLLQSTQPWVEKYRPRQVKDVAHQDEVVRVLTNTLETTNCRHMLFYRPPGTGKTTTALAIAHQLYGIIEPLASRYAKFRFKPLTEDIMTSRILHICKEEGVYLDSEALSSLSSISQGDFRRAITHLQGAARLFGYSISSKDLISVSGVIPQDVIQSLLAACRSGDFELANKEVNSVIAEGYPVSQVISQLFDVVVEADDITDEQKARICKKLGESDKCLVDGADEYLQLMDVANSAMRSLCNMQEFSLD
ncbi:hypothetical protein MKX01_019940 [Papaver californicum]|nr:hypothetical protein MKX01_019940 [Papaver californicum]